jgi:cytochrome P450
VSEAGAAPASTIGADDAALSLYRLLAPDVLADPYPLYRELRQSDPVRWDPFLHAWVVTGYDDVMSVLQDFSADRTPTPDHLAKLGMDALTPVATVMLKQMLYMDPPQHTRIRMLAARGFAPPRVEALREHIAGITSELLDRASRAGDRVDIIADFARPLPAIVSCEMLGLPAVDWPRLSGWTQSFAELLGNFQHGPVRAARACATVEAMTDYFRRAIRAHRLRPDGLLGALTTAEVDGDRLDEDEVIANAIITLVGGLETTTNLIGNGLLALLRHPDQWEQLRNDPTQMPEAIEEMLRFDSPIQHTARVAADDCVLGGHQIRRRQAVIAVIAAANRDPAAFSEPDRLDIRRAGNRHLAFGWSTHTCFGAPLARLEAQLAFAALAERVTSERAPADVRWRANAGAFRGLESLPVELR